MVQIYARRTSHGYMGGEAADVVLVEGLDC